MCDGVHRCFFLEDPNGRCYALAVEFGDDRAEIEQQDHNRSGRQDQAEDINGHGRRPARR